jgi:hypothetical protein
LTRTIITEGLHLLIKDGMLKNFELKLGVDLKLLPLFAINILEEVT